MKKLSFKGVIFDLDGVITRTAEVHSQAWKIVFDEFLKKWYDRKKQKFIPFTHEGDYIPYVDGKPRYDGIISFFKTRNIEIPFGDPSDTIRRETVCGLGNKKNHIYRKIIKEKGAYKYSSTIKFIEELQKYGIKMGIASSSKNCKFILDKTNLSHYFDTRVDGIVSAKLGLRGKPEPDIFVKSAANLGLTPSECIMVEDATSGVEAGKRGNFGLVLGIARANDHEDLRIHGADIVISDMKDITLDGIEKWFSDGLNRDSWNLTFYGFKEKEEKLRETLTTTANGYIGTRGAFICSQDDGTHYPATYMCRIYNKQPTRLHGKDIYNNDLVNCPNWLPIMIKINGKISEPLKEKVLFYKHNLDMYNGVVTREIRWENKKGEISHLLTKQFVSISNPHRGAVNMVFTPMNYSADIEIESLINGNVINNGVERYRALKSKHLMPVSEDGNKKNIFLLVKTNSSNVQIAMGATHNFSKTIEILKEEIKRVKGSVSYIAKFRAEEKQKYSIEKLAVFYNSKDVEDPLSSVKKELSNITTYNDLYKDNKKSWSSYWRRSDIEIQGDRFTQKITRLHIYHLIGTASKNNLTLDTSVPARGLTGEAYRGHIFWDELYVMPFYIHHFDKVAKSLLKYRYNRLDGARAYAKEYGYNGAMFPWQTADGGDEETQIIHYNPVSGKWDPDLSSRQRHVSIAIFYNAWIYYRRTKDVKFLEEFGAELLLDIAKFWSSIAKYEKKDNRYHISGVMGPDEFHEKYPGSKEPGLKDNAYTNIMVVWLLIRALVLDEILSENKIKALYKKLDIDTAELSRWRDITYRMAVDISNDGIIYQFEGYEHLKEIDWQYYKEKYGNIHRMDRILKAEGKSPDEYKVAKQADVLMIFYLLRTKQVAYILHRLGYNKIPRSIELLRKNYHYYLVRTSHGSTLSKVVHAMVSYNFKNYRKLWNWFSEALKSDIFDTQGGTTQEGIHCGVMAGTIDIIISAFAGISFNDYIIRVNPNLPRYWTRLSFKVKYRQNWYEFEIDNKKIIIEVKGKTEPALIEWKYKNFIKFENNRIELEF